MTKKATKADRAKAWDYVKEYFEGKEPLRLQCFFKHVSKSGMMRVFSVYVIQENQLLKVDYNLSIALGYTYNRNHNGIQFNGGGYSGPCDLAYAISYKLGEKVCTIGYEERF